jgi:hypothetical protein
MIGAAMIPRPHVAIAIACSCGGKVSIMIACDDGTIAAPAIPWSRRNNTI